MDKQEKILQFRLETEVEDLMQSLLDRVDEDELNEYLEEDLGNEEASAAEEEADGEVDAGKCTAEAILQAARDLKKKMTFQVGDTAWLMENYKKSFVTKDVNERYALNIKQKEFVQNLLEQGRRRYLMLLSFEVTAAMQLQFIKKESTNYVALMKYLAAGYFYPERFRRASPFTEVNRDFKQHVNYLVHHVFLASPYTVHLKGIHDLENENDAHEIPKALIEDALEEIAIQARRAREDSGKSGDRWGSSFVKRMDSALHGEHSLGAADGGETGADADDESTEGPLMNALDDHHAWQAYLESNWNDPNEAATTVVNAAKDLLHGSTMNQWEKYCHESLEYVRHYNGLSAVEHLLKIAACVAKQDASTRREKFESAYAQLLVFIHRFVEVKRGRQVPPWCKKGIEEIPAPGNIRNAIQKDSKAIDIAASRGESGWPTIEKIFEQAFSKRGDQYLELLLMSLMWPAKHKTGNRGIYDAIVLLHDFIVQQLFHHKGQ